MTLIGEAPSDAAADGGDGRVVGVLAVVDREEGGRERIETAGHPVTALVTLPELVARAG